MVMAVGNTKSWPKLTLEVAVQNELGFLNIMEYAAFDIPEWIKWNHVAEPQLIGI